MKKYPLIFLFLFLYSCSDDCEGIDCLSEDSFSFTIKSADTGNDLIFGDNPQITPDDIEVFYFLNGIRDNAAIESGSNEILVFLNREVHEYFVKALGETDTLTVQSFRTDGSKCCPPTTEIEEIRVNGKETNNEPTEVTALYR